MIVEQNRIQNLDGLSAVIIETLKLLSTEQQPLSVSFLSQALEKRDEVRRLLAVGTAERDGGKNGHADDARAAKIADHDPLLRAAVEEREQVLRMKDFLRRSTATLASLANRGGTGASLSKKLSAFRKTVQDGAEIEEMERSLDDVKKSITVIDEDDVLPEPPPAPRETSRATDFRQPREAMEIDAELLFRVKSIIMNVIAQFDQDLGEDYARKLAKLRKDLASCLESGSLPALETDLLALIKEYNNNMHEERSQINDFISEIGNSLMEIEQQFVQSLTQTEHSQTVRNSLNNLIDSHMDEMKKSAQLSTTLAEFKGLVITRLASIRDALEQKRKAEELREETLHVEMESLQQNLHWMKKEIGQVKEKRKALEKEILIDQLTGVANRRAAKRRLKDEIQRYQRYRQFFSVLIFDIDHFKSVNDRFGHWAGDKCLKELMKRIKPMLRETDFLARWGGEEFVVLFPGTELESAARVAERLRKAVENTRFLYNKQEIAVTISVGVTEVKPGDVTLETVFNRTDKAMYDAKKKGRNTVVAT